MATTSARNTAKEHDLNAYRSSRRAKQVKERQKRYNTTMESLVGEFTDILDELLPPNADEHDYSGNVVKWESAQALSDLLAAFAANNYRIPSFVRDQRSSGGNASTTSTSQASRPADRNPRGNASGSGTSQQGNQPASTGTNQPAAPANAPAPAAQAPANRLPRNQAAPAATPAPASTSAKTGLVGKGLARARENYRRNTGTGNA